MEPTELAAIGGTVFATAVLSGVLGMAGGVALLGVLLFYLPPLVAIPLHGVIQLVSNGSRLVAQRHHARFDWIGWYAVPLVPAGLVGLRVAQALPERVLEGAIGVVVLLATWLPKRSGAGAARAQRPRLRFVALGGCSGFLNMVVGASGVLIDPFSTSSARRASSGSTASCSPGSPCTSSGPHRERGRSSDFQLFRFALRGESENLNLNSVPDRGRLVGDELPAAAGARVDGREDGVAGEVAAVRPDLDGLPARHHQGAGQLARLDFLDADRAIVEPSAAEEPEQLLLGVDLTARVAVAKPVGEERAQRGYVSVHQRLAAQGIHLLRRRRARAGEGEQQRRECAAPPRACARRHAQPPSVWMARRSSSIRPLKDGREWIRST
jgi:hypothetical protein